MKVRYNKLGWIEAIPVQICIKYIKHRTWSITEFLATLKKYRQYLEQRSTCGCCNRKWEDIETKYVSVVFTTEPGEQRFICDECLFKVERIFKG